MELGISTFGEVHPDGTAGKAVNAHKRVQELLAAPRWLQLFVRKPVNKTPGIFKKYFPGIKKRTGDKRS